MPDHRSPSSAITVTTAVSGTIEDDLPGGTKLRLGDDVGAGALPRVFDALGRH